MATVKRGIIVGSRYSQSDAGIQYSEKWRLEGLDPTATAPVLLQARTEIAVNYGDILTGSAPALYVTEINVDPPDNGANDQAMATITWRTPSPVDTPTTVVTFNGTTVEVETDFDNSGALALVPPPSSRSDQKSILVRRRVLKPHGLLIFRREESDIPQAALPAEGATNSATWQGQPAGKWICRNISFEEIIYRPGVKVEYTFEYNPDGFSEVNVWSDPITGTIPDDITGPFTGASGNGWKRTDYAQTYNFNSLSLPTVFT